MMIICYIKIYNIKYYNMKLGEIILTDNENQLLPLTQDELADGWKQKVPKKKKNNTIHHFSIKLEELPSHLWKKLKYDKTNNFYNVKDGVYEYSIVKTELDNDIYKLYTLVLSDNLDKTLVRELYDKLESQDINGWLMIHAKKLIF